MVLFKKVTVTVLAVLLAVGMTACGGGQKAESGVPSTETSSMTAEEESADQAKEPEAASEAAQETEVPETAAETTPEAATETVTEAATEAAAETEAASEPGPEPGHFSDPSAFEGFQTYTCGSREVRFGETYFRDTGDIPVERVMQFADETHEGMKDPDVLEGGAVGRIVTGYYSKTGGQLSYTVYNPGEDPAAFEDCVIVGVQDEEGMTFSNGIDYYTVTPEALMEILGEPYEIRGKYDENNTQATFIWRDESGDHNLTLSYYRDAEISDMNGLSYMDLSGIT